MSTGPVHIHLVAVEKSAAVPFVLNRDRSKADLQRLRRKVDTAARRPPTGTSDLLSPAGPGCYAVAQGSRDVVVHDLTRGATLASLRRKP